MRGILDRLDLAAGPSPHWHHWNITGRRSETKAAIARFNADHPDMNNPWGYTPALG